MSLCVIIPMFPFTVLTYYDHLNTRAPILPSPRNTTNNKLLLLTKQTPVIIAWCAKSAIPVENRHSSRKNVSPLPTDLTPTITRATRTIERIPLTMANYLQKWCPKARACRPSHRIFRRKIMKELRQTKSTNHPKVKGMPKCRMKKINQQRDSIPTILI